METTGIVPSELDLRRGPQLVSPRPSATAAAGAATPLQATRRPLHRYYRRCSRSRGRTGIGEDVGASQFRGAAVFETLARRATAPIERCSSLAQNQATHRQPRWAWPPVRVRSGCSAGAQSRLTPPAAMSRRPESTTPLRGRRTGGSGRWRARATQSPRAERKPSRSSIKPPQVSRQSRRSRQAERLEGSHGYPWDPACDGVENRWAPLGSLCGWSSSTARARSARQLGRPRRRLWPR